MAESYARVRTSLASVRSSLRHDTERLEYEQAAAEQRAIIRLSEQALASYEHPNALLPADREKVLAKAVGSNEADRKRNLTIELAFDSEYQAFKDRVRESQELYDELQAELDVLDREQRQTEFAVLDKYADALLGKDGTTVSIRQHPAFDSPRDIVAPVAVSSMRTGPYPVGDPISVERDITEVPITDVVMTETGQAVLVEREPATVTKLVSKADRKLNRSVHHVKE